MTRYPDLKLSIAILCNSTSRTGPLEPDIFNEIMGPFPAPTPAESVELKPEELQRYVGLWRDEKTHFPVRTTVSNGALRFQNTVMRPQKDGTFRVGPSKVTFGSVKDSKPMWMELDNSASVVRLVNDPEWTPPPAELSSFAGKWYSDEAEAMFSVIVAEGKLFLTQRPATRLQLQPLFKDHFAIANRPGTVVWFTRDNGKLTMHVGTSRLRDMPFMRVQ